MKKKERKKPPVIDRTGMREWRHGLNEVATVVEDMEVLGLPGHFGRNRESATWYLTIVFLPGSLENLLNTLVSC